MFENKFLKIKRRLIRFLIFLNQIKPYGLGGMSIYKVSRLYISGLINGSIGIRTASISYNFFMALFPFTLFLLTLIPYIPIDGFQEDILAFFIEITPNKTYSGVNQVFNDIANNQYGGLLSLGVLVSIFLMSNGVYGIFSAFETSFNVENHRNYFSLYALSIIMAITFSFLLILFTIAFLFYETGIYYLIEKKWFEMSDMLLMIIQYSKYLIYILMVYFFTSALYYYGLKQNVKTTSYFSIGSIFTTLFILISFFLFNYYVKHFSRYNELYGSIGTLLIFMLFTWVNSYILILGFELNVAIHKLKIKQLAFKRNGV